MRYTPPVKISVIGTGYMGSLHVRKLANLDGAKLVGVWDIDKSKAQKVADEFGTKAFKSFDEAVGYSQAVVLATPSNTHGKLGMQIIEVGRNILIEKPIADSEDEADILIEFAAERDAILMVGHIENFNPAYIVAKKYITKPVFVEAHRLTAFRDRGGDVSVVEDLMIHDLELIPQFCGTDVESIDISGAAVITKKPDIAHVRMKYNDGLVVNLTSSRLSLSAKRKIRIFQKDAYIGIDFGERTVEIARMAGKNPEGKIVRLGNNKVEVIRPEIPKTDPLEEELKFFIESINKNKPVDNSTAVWAIKMCGYILRHSK
ncbi:Gfo/Idh/MocA family oxidoreductase [bacterium]|nr:Gfo/Idh/MocA family oxidoreductase [bacterium]